MEFDPTQAIGSWKKAWRKLTVKAELPGLRFHDCRHSTITALLTDPRVSIQTAKSIAGHVSQRMIDRHSHIHLEAKRNAVEALSEQPQATVDAAIDATG
jgi:integrase